MKKFWQRTKEVQKEKQSERRLTRKERYQKKYLNSDKAFDLLSQLLEKKLICNNKIISNQQQEQGIPNSTQCIITIKHYDLVEPFSQKISKLLNLEEIPSINGNEQELVLLNTIYPGNRHNKSEYTTKSPIIAIFCVTFHHKRGSEIELCYPQIDHLFKNAKDKDELLNKVTTYALPDAVHNTDEDYLYFNMVADIMRKLDSEAQRCMLFGVTYFKQIKVTEQMRKNDPELTRSHLQKAICMLSFESLFGYIKNRIEPTIRAYFAQDNFSDTHLIQFAFENIQQALDYNTCNDNNCFITKGIKNLEIAEIYAGTTPRALFLIFKDKLFRILKAIMLEMKIIVFSLNSSVCSNFLISLLSLLPGMLSFNLQNKHLHHQVFLLIRYCGQKCYLSDFGQPLKIFSEDNPFFLYFSINDLGELLDRKPKGYLIGTTNKFIKTMGKLDPDLIVDIDDEQIIIKEVNKKVLNLKQCDKKLYEMIYNNSLKCLDVGTRENLKRFRSQQQNLDVKFMGSEDWIRQQVYKYILKFTCECSYLVQNLAQFTEQVNRLAMVRTRKSILLKQERILEQTEVVEKGEDDSVSSGEEEGNEQMSGQFDEETKKSKEQLIKDLHIRDLRLRIQGVMKSLSKYNRKMAVQWLCGSENGRVWLSQHDKYIGICSDSYEDEYANDVIVLTYENGDIYVGKALKNGLQHQHGVLYEIVQSRVYAGEFREGQKHGKGKQESLLSKQWQYSGQYVNNQRHGQGKLIVSDEYQYNGHFENDQFNGYGNLQLQNSVYEGQFVNGVYNGTGKLIMENHDVYVGQFMNGQFSGEGQYVWGNGDIYKGGWKGGKRHGMGIFQCMEYVYEGEWVNDLKEGFGLLNRVNENAKYQGQFINDELDTSQKIIIKYGDGSIYQGLVKDWKPNGYGYLSMSDGAIKEGQFHQGNYMQEEEDQ